MRAKWSRWNCPACGKDIDTTSKTRHLENEKHLRSVKLSPSSDLTDFLSRVNRSTLSDSERTMFNAYRLRNALDGPREEETTYALSNTTHSK